MTRFFSHWFGTAQTAGAARARKRTLLRVETLEERAVPATLQVTSLLDNGSAGTLRSEIAAAQPGDTIDITVPGTITLNAGKDQLAISENLTIVGLGENLDTITASFKTRVFDVTAANVTLNLSGLTITGGRTAGDASGLGDGGAVDAQQKGDTVNINNCVISGSAATKAGGAVDANNLSITNSTISGNSAGAGGGGVIGQNVTIEDSTISGNTAKTNGGGVAATSKISVINSTISGNTAAGQGGGIWLANETNAGGSSLLDDTIANNTSKTGGGGLVVGLYVNLTLDNTIIASNADTSGKAPDILGKVTANNSLILSTSGVTFLGSTATDILKKNPDLGTLQSNGGTTQTMALQTGSPAINTGSNSLVPAGDTTDQRGDARIVGATVDMGAFEVQTASTAAASTSTTTKS